MLVLGLPGALGCMGPLIPRVPVPVRGPIIVSPLLLVPIIRLPRGSSRISLRGQASLRYLIPILGGRILVILGLRGPIIVSPLLLVPIIRVPRGSVRISLRGQASLGDLIPILGGRILLVLGLPGAVGCMVPLIPRVPRG